MTTEQFLTSASGWAISALFKYLPALRERFDRLDGLGKRISVALAVLIVSLAVFALKCTRVIDVPILEPCTRAGWLDLASIALMVALNTQAAYLLLPNSNRGAAAVPTTDLIPEPFPRIDAHVQ